MKTKVSKKVRDVLKELGMTDANKIPVKFSREMVIQRVRNFHRDNKDARVSSVYSHDWKFFIMMGSFLNEETNKRELVALFWGSSRPYTTMKQCTYPIEHFQELKKSLAA